MSIDYSSFQLNDKIAIVTGPSQGIGRAIALGLAQAGAHLVLAEHPAMHQDSLEEVKCEIERMGRRTLVVPTDISSVAQIRAMVDKAKEVFGRIDILVNNASWTCTGPAIDATEEDYDGTMDTCVKNVFFACQAAARVMIPQGGGRIVNIGSNFPSHLRRRQGRRASVVPGAVPGVGQQGSGGERGGALHHRDALPQADSGTAGLQGVGH